MGLSGGIGFGSTGAGAGSPGLPQLFTWQPGGTGVGPSVFASFAAACAACAAATLAGGNAPTTLHFDDSVSPCDIPAGTYDYGPNCTLLGSYDEGGSYVVITSAGIVSFASPPVLVQSLDIRLQSPASPSGTWLVTGIVTVRFYDCYYNGDQSTAAGNLFCVSGNGTALFLFISGSTAILNSAVGTPVFVYCDTSGGGTRPSVACTVDGGSAVLFDTFAADSTQAQIVFSLTSPLAVVDSSQGGLGYTPPIYGTIQAGSPNNGRNLSRGPNATSVGDYAAAPRTAQLGYASGQDGTKSEGVTQAGALHLIGNTPGAVPGETVNLTYGLGQTIVLESTKAYAFVFTLDVAAVVAGLQKSFAYKLIASVRVGGGGVVTVAGQAVDGQVGDAVLADLTFSVVGGIAGALTVSYTSGASATRANLSCLAAWTETDFQP